MTDCPNAEIRDLLPELMHGRLDAATRGRVEGHVASCAECRAELALLRSARAALSAAPRVDIARISRVLPRPLATPRSVRQKPAWRQWRVAATIAVLATGGLTLATLERTGGLGSDPIVADTQIGQTDSGAAMARGGEEYALSVGGALGDLTDAQLQGLLDGLEDLETLPSLEPDAAVPAATGLAEAL